MGETNAPRARSSLLFYALLTDFQGGRDAVASWVGIQQRRPSLYLLANVTVVVAAHNPCRGGGGVEHKETSSAQRGCPTGCPSLWSSHFDTFGGWNLMGCSSRKVTHRVLWPEDPDVHVTQLESSSSFSASSSSAEVRDEPEAHNSTPIIVRGDSKSSIPLPSHRLYLCFWESVVCSPQ